MSLSHSERESYLRRHMVEIAEEHFPDDVEGLSRARGRGCRRR